MHLCDVSKLTGPMGHALTRWLPFGDERLDRAKAPCLTPHFHAQDPSLLTRTSGQNPGPSEHGGARTHALHLPCPGRRDAMLAGAR